MERLTHQRLSRYVSILEVVAEKKGQLPMEPDLTEFDDYIENLRDSANERGHLDAVRVGLAEALQSDDDIRDLARADFAWREPQLRRIIQYAYDKLFPDHPIDP